MKILSEYETFNVNNMQIKTPTPFKGGLFSEIRYKKHPLYILTPKMVVPFGISSHNSLNALNSLNSLNSSSSSINSGISPGISPGSSGINLGSSSSGNKSISLSISFTDRDVDPKIVAFEKIVVSIDKYLARSEQIVNRTDITYKPSLKTTSSLMSLKTASNRDYTTTIYDVNKKEIDVSEIQEKSHIICIVHLSGIWINDEAYGPQWNIVQMRLDPPQELKPFAILEDYSSPTIGLRTYDSIPDIHIQNPSGGMTVSTVSTVPTTVPVTPIIIPTPPPLPPKGYLLPKQSKIILGKGRSIPGLRKEDKDRLKVPNQMDIIRGLRALRKTDKTDNKKYTSDPLDDILTELKIKLSKKRESLQHSVLADSNSFSDSINLSKPDKTNQ